MSTLHVHIDESGNFDFSNRGSRFFIVTAAWTYEPAALAAAITNLRFHLIKEDLGTSYSSFHANDDAAPIRERVLDVMLQYPAWNFAAVVVEKRKVNPSLYEPHVFYPKFLSMVLRFIFRGRLRPGTHKVMICTDTLPFQKRADRDAVETTVKRVCREELPEISFKVLTQRREANAWLQIADYCSWSVCRKWEHGNLQTYERLRARLAAKELDPMSRGSGIVYY